MCPSQSDEIKKISLFNLTACKSIEVIHKLFDILFLFHDDGGNIREGVPENSWSISQDN